MKHFKRVVLSSLIFALATILLVGCSHDSDNPTSPGEITETTAIPMDAKFEDIQVLYTGGESEEDVRKSLEALDTSAKTMLTDTKKEEILESFRNDLAQHPEWKMNSSNSSIAKSWSYVGAYTTWTKWRAWNDLDLYLEYKWWVGSQNPTYQMYSSTYTLYYALRACYGGNVGSYPWKEGNYKRVTAVVGNCVYSWLSRDYIRRNLLVRSWQ